MPGFGATQVLPVDRRDTKLDGRSGPLGEALEDVAIAQDHLALVTTDSKVQRGNDLKAADKPIVPIGRLILIGHRAHGYLLALPDPTDKLLDKDLG